MLIETILFLILRCKWCAFQSQFKNDDEYLENEQPLQMYLKYFLPT